MHLPSNPPYGIKFGSNWQVSTRDRDVTDGKTQDLTRQPEQIRAFRDTWQLGIHSYLSYLHERVLASHDLLAQSGSLFLQIGDANLHLARSVIEEIFGAENFCALITFKKTTGATGDLLPGTNDYILWFAKSLPDVKYRQLYHDKVAGGAGASAYVYVEEKDGSRRALTATERRDQSPLPAGARLFRRDNLTSQSAGREKGEGAASWFAVDFEGREFRPNLQSRWKTNETGMERLRLANRLIWYGNTLACVRYIDDFPTYPLPTGGTTRRLVMAMTKGVRGADEYPRRREVPAVIHRPR